MDLIGFVWSEESDSRPLSVEIVWSAVFEIGMDSGSIKKERSSPLNAIF